jgi:putative ABC transport system permease protein
MRDLRFWRWRREDDAEVDHEVETHLRLATEEKIEAGLPPREAELAARREFGSVALMKEELRGPRPSAGIDRLCQEVRFAARRLVRAPAFSVTAVSTLALAIGANVCIFVLVQRVLINSLGYPDAGRLIALDFGWPSRNIPSGLNTIPARLYFQYADRTHTLVAVAAYRTEDLTLSGPGTPERIRVARTTPSLTAVLRVAPALGRFLTTEEGEPGAPPVIVLSHGLWTRRYGADPAILGRPVVLNGVPTTIAGVMPSSFAYPDSRVDAWLAVPLSRSGEPAPLDPSPTTQADAYSFAAVARLRDGIALDDARVEMTRLSVALEDIAPGNGYKDLTSTALTLQDATVGRVAKALWLLMGSAGVVLLVACANVANLFLVRCEARQREIAVRRALGAGAGGIARYFLAESILLTGTGGAVGLAVAWCGVAGLVAARPANLPRIDEVYLDGAGVAFTCALSILAALIFGCVPLLRLASTTVTPSNGGRSTTTSRTGLRTRHVLMAGQVALALVLLVASGLLFRSFHRLRARDPGFNAASALTFQVGLPRSDYPNRRVVVAAHLALLDRLASVPGVTAVSATTCVPLSGRGFCSAAPIYVDGETVAPGANRPLGAARPVAAAFVETMGMRLIRGRGINRQDVERNEAVAVVNEAFVHAALGPADPIGQRVRLGQRQQAGANVPVWLTVVGVVANTPTVALAEPMPVPKMYFPMFSAYDVWPVVDVMTYVVRTGPSPSVMTQSLRSAVRAVDPNLPLAQVRTLQDILDQASAQMTFTMVLMAIAAVAALALGLVGIYGATAYVVSQRTGEIGVRLALGARPGSVAALIVRQGGFVTLAGVVVGLAAALAGSRLLESLLYGVTARDPEVFAATAALLVAVALLACWLPARRAARMSPLAAIRAE